MQQHEPETVTGSDLVWGAKAIAKSINRPERATFYLLETGKIPAKKIGGRWVASWGKLRGFLVESSSSEMEAA